MSIKTLPAPIDLPLFGWSYRQNFHDLDAQIAREIEAAFIHAQPPHPSSKFAPFWDPSIWLAATPSPAVDEGLRAYVVGFGSILNPMPITAVSGPWTYYTADIEALESDWVTAATDMAAVSWKVYQTAGFGIEHHGQSAGQFRADEPGHFWERWTAAKR